MCMIFPEHPSAILLTAATNFRHVYMTFLITLITVTLVLHTKHYSCRLQVDKR